LETDRRIIEHALGRRAAAVFTESSVLALAFEFEAALRGASFIEPRNVARLMIGLAPSAEFSDEAWRICLAAGRRFADEADVVFRGTRTQLAKLIRRKAGMNPLGVNLVPRTQADGTTGYLIVANEVSGFLGYATSLLIDPARGFGRRLRWCALEKCGKYFLQPEKVRLRQYCSDDHRDQAHDSDAAVRVAASRAGMSAKDYRRRHK
jgi:hypothetical protein